MARIRSKCSSPFGRFNQTLKSVVLYSRALGTVRTYTNGFRRWTKWAVDNNVQPIPANPVHVSLFLTSIFEGTSSHHSVRNTMDSIDWSHKVAGLEPPSSHPVARSIFAAPQRICGEPTIKKSPLLLWIYVLWLRIIAKEKLYITAEQLRCVLQVMPVF